MEYTVDLFTRFLNSLEKYSRECEDIENEYKRKLNEYNKSYERKIEKQMADMTAAIKRFSADRAGAFKDYDAFLSDTESSESRRRREIADQIFTYMGNLYEIDERIHKMSCYTNYSSVASSISAARAESLPVSLDEIATMINRLEHTGKSKFEAAAADFAKYINGVMDGLNEKIKKLFDELYANSEDIGIKRDNDYNSCKNKLKNIDDNVKSEMFDFFKNLLTVRKNAELDRDMNIKKAKAEKEKSLKEAADSFHKLYPPEKFKEEFLRIHYLEPDPDDYTCTNEIPSTFRIGDMVYALSNLNITGYTEKMLKKYYFFLIKNSFSQKREAFLKMPYSVNFDKEFNYLFELTSENRHLMIDRICSMAMRLFMMIPPSKINFTFLDPIKLGATFALFGRLVETDDRTNKVINGKIWTSATDIQDKLQIMTEHIANITQRCLQGRYKNIREYNEAAAQNAESYQVLMIMDFPANFNEESLKLLEQIISTGPKCGVYTVIMKSDEQYEKTDDRRIKSLVNNIVNNVTKFVCHDKLTFSHVSYNDIRVELDIPPLFGATELDKIVPVLKEGIRTADKVVIDYNKMLSNAKIQHSTEECIRIPIGIHGANEVQYFTLGTGGSHHALIAGVAGSGKSTLLHNIILGLLSQYSPEELSIYLVDFKRGVEFKIYADYVLPVFKVVAIESEREFGYNVLAALEREQKIRANLFKKSNVYKLSEYRQQGKKMPRILVIMDEFQELFPESGDELSRKSAEILERIVRQGRAFGVHLMLATQSYSNVRGVDKSVFEQMAVRIVLKCSPSDANLLLDDGASVVEQISIDDPGRAVYNSEAGNKEFNSHFRVAYIPTENHRTMLEKISEETAQYRDPDHPTRVLLTNIENNNFSIFRQFTAYTAETYKKYGQLYIGESLELTNDMAIKMDRSEYSNILMIGSDTDMARSMFTFAILSVCINYWIKHRSAPEKPIITLLNAKPLNDSYFKDTVKLMADYLPDYIKYVTNDDAASIKKTVSEYYKQMIAGNVQPDDQFFFVFGYQRAEDLRSDERMEQFNEIDDIFNIAQNYDAEPNCSIKEMMLELIRRGSQNGVHTVIWQDNFNSLYLDDKGMISYFAMRVAFDMSPDNYSNFIGYDAAQPVGKNNAVLYSKTRDNQKFRPYQTPDDDWLKEICDKIK